MPHSQTDFAYQSDEAEWFRASRIGTSVDHGDSRLRLRVATCLPILDTFLALLGVGLASVDISSISVCVNACSVAGSNARQQTALCYLHVPRGLNSSWLLLTYPQITSLSTTKIIFSEDQSLRLRFRLWLGRRFYDRDWSICSPHRVPFNKIAKLDCYPTEAEAIEFVRVHTTIPVPKVHAIYKSGAKLDLVLGFVKGESLAMAWKKMPFEGKCSVVGEIAGYVQ